MKYSLLSRLAENLYWFGRYIERAENLARLVAANANLALDLPGRQRLDWYTLIESTGSEFAFEQSSHNPTELGIVRFLIADSQNPGSIVSSLRFARENLRTSRDRIPREVSEAMNKLYAVISTDADGAIRRTSARFELLRSVIDLCQQLRGYLNGTMSRGYGFHFIRCGQMLERADMTTRIMDVRLEDLVPEDQELPPAAEALQWMAVLRSLSAYQMYRRDRQGAIKARHVVRFLMLDELFPRSVMSSLNRFREFVAVLPRSNPILDDLDRIVDSISALRETMLSVENTQLHRTIDELQQDIQAIHGTIERTYFAPTINPD